MHEKMQNQTANFLGGKSANEPIHNIFMTT